FPEVVQTPNFLQDVDRKYFEGKPALIVAAGPSLNDEIEHIRKIKEQGLAYIFTVGSAINSLVHAGIYPDAAFTYDPTEKNQIVFEKLKEENITEIPLVFGSSVGYETLQNHPSEKKFHMITSQDTISPYYLVSKGSEPIEGVYDAPSIAVVTLQALFRIGCSPIVLVGQNLGYKEDSRYAEGISYATKVNEAEKKLTVESVDGTTIYTNESFLRMKHQLESYIARIPNGQVINTTKHGAKIEGATFQPLNEVMDSSFKEGTVTDSWLDAKPSYSHSHVAVKVEEMERATEQFESLLSQLVEGIVRMEQLAETMQAKELIKLFDKFDQAFGRFQQNKFYEVVLKPMVRVQADLTHKKVQSIRFNNDPVAKSAALVQAIGPFLYECQQDAKMIAPAYHWMVNKMKEITTTEKVQAE
ncbi:MAG TPA: DUF115 domain-containing protein, partial [Bacilli bacterium]|nr:DUF115 domain-containing protein [Bacilli bacterium]